MVDFNTSQHMLPLLPSQQSLQAISEGDHLRERSKVQRKFYLLGCKWCFVSDAATSRSYNVYCKLCFVNMLTLRMSHFSTLKKNSCLEFHLLNRELSVSTRPCLSFLNYIFRR